MSKPVSELHIESDSHHSVVVEEEPEAEQFGEALSNSAADEFSVAEFEEAIPERVVNLPTLKSPDEKCACLPRVMMVDNEEFSCDIHAEFFKESKTEYDYFTCAEKAIDAYEKSLQKSCCKVSYPLVITDI